MRAQSRQPLLECIYEVSEMTVNAKPEAKSIEIKVSTDRSSTIFGEQLVRLIGLMRVRHQVIQGFRPSSAGESESQPLTWAFCDHWSFSVNSLYCKRIQHKIVELHVALRQALTVSFGGKLAPAKLSISIWTCGRASSQVSDGWVSCSCSSLASVSGLWMFANKTIAQIVEIRNQG